VTVRRAFTLAASFFGAAAALPRAAAAQSFVSQPQHYLLTTEAVDGRALWVQPAGLVARHESSVSAMATADRVGGSLALGQYGVTLAAGPLGIGWQHDRLGSAAHGDAFVVGYAVGRPDRSVGFDHRWHRGTNIHSSAWDFGARYAPTSALVFSLVWRDVGSPVIGDTIRATLVPGAALALLNGRLEIGADWEIVTDGWGSSAVRAGVALTLPARLALGVRAEFGSFDRRGLAVDLTWNGHAARLTAFRSSVRSDDVDRYGVWAAAVANPQARRRRGTFR
jgi:hypothetical protein